MQFNRGKMEHSLDGWMPFFWPWWWCCAAAAGFNKLNLLSGAVVVEEITGQVGVLIGKHKGIDKSNYHSWTPRVVI